MILPKVQVQCNSTDFNLSIPAGNYELFYNAAFTNTNLNGSTTNLLLWGASQFRQINGDCINLINLMGYELYPIQVNSVICQDTICQGGFISGLISYSNNFNSFAEFSIVNDQYFNFIYTNDQIGVIPFNFSTLDFYFPGVYNIDFVGSINNVCFNQQVITKQIVVVPELNVDITFNSNFLTASGGTGTYQWFLNGVEIQGFTSSTYTPTQNGLYTAFSSNNYCQDSSNSILISTVSNKHVINNKLLIYPNPTNSQLNFNIKDNFNYEITNIEGKILLKGYTSEFIKLSDLEPGLYFITISIDNIFYHEKFIKN